MLENQFDFNDFLKQAEMMNAMGSMASMARMIPGVAGRVSDAQMAQAEKSVRSAKSLILSMTPAERRTPEARCEALRAEAAARMRMSLRLCVDACSGCALTRAIRAVRSW
jgi:signal recognition particle subunit SRP54